MAEDWRSAVGEQLDLLLDTGRAAEAESRARALVAAEPDDRRWWLMLAIVLQRQARPAEAVDPCRRAIALNPALPYAYEILADSYRLMGRWDEACTAAREAIARDPHAPWPYLILATALAATGTSNAPAAREALSTGLELAPADPDTLLAAARVTARLGDQGAAAGLVDDGLAIDPTHHDLLFLRAQLTGNELAEVRALTSLLRTSPLSHDAHDAVAAVFWRRFTVVAALMSAIPVAVTLSATFEDLVLSPVAAPLAGLFSLGLTVPLLWTMPPGFCRRTVRAHPRLILACGLLTVACLILTVCGVLVLVPDVRLAASGATVAAAAIVFGASRVIEAERDADATRAVSHEAAHSRRLEHAEASRQKDRTVHQMLGLAGLFFLAAQAQNEAPRLEGLGPLLIVAGLCFLRSQADRFWLLRRTTADRSEHRGRGRDLLLVGAELSMITTGAAVWAVALAGG